MAFLVAILKNQEVYLDLHLEVLEDLVLQADLVLLLLLGDLDLLLEEDLERLLPHLATSGPVQLV